ASGRYDVFPILPLYATVARLLKTPFDDLVRTSAAAQARYDSTTVYKKIFETTKVEEIADRFARFNAAYYDFGSFSGTLAVTGKDKQVTTHFERIPAYLAPWFGTMHNSYTEAAMKIAGAREVTILGRRLEPAGSQYGYPLVTFHTDIRWA